MTHRVATVPVSGEGRCAGAGATPIVTPMRLHELGRRAREELRTAYARRSCSTRTAAHEMSWKVEGSMAITDELIETLGGGGTAGLAVAAAVLVPTVYPPARRGLRGLAKAAIVQYLR